MSNLLLTQTHLRNKLTPSQPKDPVFS